MPYFTLPRILFSSGSFRIKLLKLLDFFFGTLLACVSPIRKQPRSLPTYPQKMLIIRPGGIGDAVFLLPVLKALRTTYPSLKINILCENRNAEPFHAHPLLVDQIFLYHSWHDLTSLFKHAYDVIIDTEQWHLLSAVIASRLHAQTTIGFATRPLRSKLFDHPVPYQTNTYELENLRTLFSSLLGNKHPLTTIDHSFETSSSLLDWATAQIPASSIIIALATSTPERRLFTEHIILLIQHILSIGHTPVLLGGQDVEKTAMHILHQMPPAGIINLTGKTTLKESAALIKRSVLYIGPDSGLTHLACAVGTKVIAVFGPGNAAQWAPRGKKHITISRHLPCAPCTVFGYSLPTCRGRYDCMRTIPINVILKEISACAS